MAVCVEAYVVYVQHYLHRLKATILSHGHLSIILVGTGRPRGDNEPRPRFLLRGSYQTKVTYTKATGNIMVFNISTMTDRRLGCSSRHPLQINSLTCRIAILRPNYRNKILN